MYILRRIGEWFGHMTQLNLIYREANKVADISVKMAHRTQSKMDFCRNEDLPREVHKLIFLDRIGLPCFRSNCK